MDIKDGLSGRDLWGDDFTDKQIAEWYQEEENGYYQLASEHYGISTSEAYKYEYNALNEFHAFSLLRKRNYGVCVALGCAAGDDVVPLAPVVDQFFGIEPAQKWWSTSIGGKPAKYLKPQIKGDIEFEDGPAELVTALGVLHHIPNVSFLLTEIYRILSPGGIFVMREPIVSMGDWRTARTGLTKNERGIPLDWLNRKVKAVGFEVVRRRLCMFGPLSAALRAARISNAYNSIFFVGLDDLCSRLFEKNISYMRTGILSKFAPSSVFLILRKS